MKNVVLETIQWATLPHIHDVRPIGEKDHEVLNDLREVLQRHGYTHRFGISLLHKHFDVDSDECLVEYTEMDSRTQRVVVEKRHPSTPGWIETVWRFSDATNVTLCEQECKYEDAGHKHIHSIVGR